MNFPLLYFIQTFYFNLRRCVIEEDDVPCDKVLMPTKTADHTMHIMIGTIIALTGKPKDIFDIFCNNKAF